MSATTFPWLRLFCGLIGIWTSISGFKSITRRAAEFRAKGFNGEIAHAFKSHKRGAWARLIVSVALVASSFAPGLTLDRFALAVVSALVIWTSVRSIADIEQQEVLAADRLHAQETKAE